MHKTDRWSKAWEIFENPINEVMHYILSTNMYQNQHQTKVPTSNYRSKSTWPSRLVPDPRPALGPVRFIRSTLRQLLRDPIFRQVVLALHNVVKCASISYWMEDNQSMSALTYSPSYTIHSWQRRSHVGGAGRRRLTASPYSHPSEVRRLRTYKLAGSGFAAAAWSTKLQTHSYKVTSRTKAPNIKLSFQVNSFGILQWRSDVLWKTPDLRSKGRGFDSHLQTLPSLNATSRKRLKAVFKVKAKINTVTLRAQKD